MNNAHDVAALARVDLNLLVSLDLLLQEHSVTRAARRAGVTQSAMSHALARLREVFSDPLLVRAGGVMITTDRAARLQAPLRRAIRDLERTLLEPDGFDPATSVRTFRIAGLDVSEMALLPGVLAAVSRDAPGLSVSFVRPAGRPVAAELASGSLDVFLGVIPASSPLTGVLPDPGEGGTRRRVLLREGWACLVRRDHPRIRQRPGLTAYVREPHALVSPSGEDGPGLVDRILARRKLSRRVAIRLADFRSAIDAVAMSDCLVNVPERLVAWAERHFPVRAFPVPLDIPPSVLSMVWHERSHHDPAHAWLRRLLIRSAGAARGSGR